MADAGWGFNVARVGLIGNILQPTTDINDVPFRELVKQPIFYPFQTMSSRMNSLETFEYNEKDWQQYIMRAKLLGSAIPATSFAAGANAMRETTSKPYQNYEGKDWPRRDARWHHSDLKNVAYYFTYKLYEKISNNK